MAKCPIGDVSFWTKCPIWDTLFMRSVPKWSKCPKGSK